MARGVRESSGPVQRREKPLDLPHPGTGLRVLCRVWGHVLHRDALPLEAQTSDLLLDRLDVTWRAVWVAHRFPLGTLASNVAFAWSTALCAKPSGRSGGAGSW